MADQAKHAYGSRANLEAAIEAGLVDAFDVLFLNGEGEKPTIGWVDKNGNPVIVENDTAEMKDQIAELETQMSAVEETLSEQVSVEYVISHKPDGTIVDYRDKEIRVMCPANTEWVLQQSGANADNNKYYIGFKAYAPSASVVSFKESVDETITDTTMYYFENNEFAGVEDDGRKYSIVWLPAAVYDETTGAWTYYGANSTTEKYIGWYYSVEWYNEAGTVIASDCIRINLSNEACHSSIAPFYVNASAQEVEDKIDQATTDVLKAANAYTDEQIAQAFVIVEF